jgi:hypothetical protein
MKISAFHLMPHRELPADFEKRYPSVWDQRDPVGVGRPAIRQSADRNPLVRESPHLADDAPLGLRNRLDR